MAERAFHGIRAKSRIDAFGLAALSGKLKEMQLLLDDGVEIDAVAPPIRSPALAYAAHGGNLPVVEFLLEHGAGIDVTGVFELTPLMLACSIGKVKCSRVALFLIESGADVNYFRKSDEMTALKFAVKNCDRKVIQALIDHGAQIDGPKRTEQTALMLAARANNVEALKVLVSNGASLSLGCKLPWAENRTAQGLAELEKQHKAAKYLASLA